MDNTSLANMVEAAVAKADDGPTLTVTSEKAATKILDEKHCGETVLMSHLQDDTAHHYVSFLTRSQLEAHDPAHI